MYVKHAGVHLDRQREWKEQEADTDPHNERPTETHESDKEGRRSVKNSAT